MHVYNAIIVLKEILPVFPLASVHPCGGDINEAVDRLLEREQRGDLKILGKAWVFCTMANCTVLTYISRYSASLKKREHFWMPKTSPKVRQNHCRYPLSLLRIETGQRSPTPFVRDPPTYTRETSQRSSYRPSSTEWYLKHSTSTFTYSFFGSFWTPRSPTHN